LVPFAPEYRCVRLFLETMTLLRIELVATESNLEFIMGQLARVPTRKQLARSAGDGRHSVPSADLGIRVTLARPSGFRSRYMSQPVITIDPAMSTGSPGMGG
jgi:hypothetical protein